MAREFSRTDRVSQQIHKEVASILQNEYKHKAGDLPLITVSGVDVSRDLAHAKVFITCYTEDDESTNKHVAELNENKGFIRSILAKRIRMRAVPAIHFHTDGSITEGMRISNLVSQTIAEDEKRRKDNGDEEQGE
jgi:ribosome-binding factor A